LKIEPWSRIHRSVVVPFSEARRVVPEVAWRHAGRQGARAREVWAVGQAGRGVDDRNRSIGNTRARQDSSWGQVRRNFDNLEADGNEQDHETF
jgi:hypothetical protein